MYNVWNDLVAEVACEPDYTPCSCMNVGHDAYFPVGKYVD